MVAVNKCEGSYCSPNPGYDPSLGFEILGRTDSLEHLPRFRVILQLDHLMEGGDYLLDTIPNEPGSATVRCGLVVGKYFQNKFSLSTLDSGTFYRGQLHISKWVKGQDGFVSGTFWFDLYNPAQYPDTVRVREGRFDIPFQ